MSGTRAGPVVPVPPPTMLVPVLSDRAGYDRSMSSWDSSHHLSSSRSLDVVAIGLGGALTLIDPARLGPGRRFGYRLAIAGLAGATFWRGLADDELSVAPETRLGLTAGVAGATLAGAELSEAADARLQAWLSRAGVRRPRLLMAAATLGTGLAGLALEQRLAPVDAQEEDLGFLPGPRELPPAVRDLVAALLSQTEDYDSLRLRAQLERATEIVWPGEQDVSMRVLEFEVPGDVPLTVPRTFDFPVVARFVSPRGVPCRITLSVSDGRLSLLTRDVDVDLWDEIADDWRPMGGSSADPLADVDSWPDVDQLEFVHDSALNAQRGRGADERHP